MTIIEGPEFLMDIKSIKNSSGRLGKFHVNQWADTSILWSQWDFCTPQLSLRSHDFFTSERNFLFVSFNKNVSFQKQF